MLNNVKFKMGLVIQSGLMLFPAKMYHSLIIFQFQKKLHFFKNILPFPANVCNAVFSPSHAVLRVRQGV